MNYACLLSCAALTSFLLSGTATAEATGSASAGEAIFAQCKTCHQIGAGATNRVGPHLNGLYGRRAASIDGYRYSRPMLRAGADGLFWTYETLDAFLENPKSMVSRTKMTFRGLKSDQDRADLLAYLRTFSDDPSNLPGAEPTARPVDHDLDPAILALTGDPEYGEYLSSDCKTCHQTTGANDGIPAITGWPEEDFVVAMHAYKRKLRPHPVMQMMAGRLGDEEIAALAAYFKELE